jgi:hypothetical protein
MITISQTNSKRPWQTALAVFFAVGFLQTPALAARAKVQSSLEPTTVLVPVPQTQLYLPDLIKREEPHNVYFDIYASNWSSERIEQRAVLPDVSPFATGTVSRFSLNGWSTDWAFSRFYVTPKLGVAFTQLQRTGRIDLAGANDVGITEWLNVYAGRLALEFSTSQSPESGLHPFLNVAVLPSWLQSPPNPLNRSGVSRTTLVGESQLGVAWYSKSIGNFLGTRTVGITAGLEGTTGLGDVAFQGYGFTIGSRIGFD